jgi:hypothetical protein
MAPRACASPFGTGGTLDGVATVRHVYHKRRVIEVERAPALQQRDRRLEDLAVESHRVTSGTRGDPRQVDGGGR